MRAVNALGEHLRCERSLISMVRFFIPLSVFCLALFMAACSAGRRGEVPLHAPAPAHKTPPSPLVSAPPKLSAGEYAVAIDSEPTGGMVVVNGVPVGRAPQRVVLAGSARGFSLNEVSIKVRFVAADTDHVSQTIEALLTPLDKIPASIRFTPTGATRVVR